MSALLRCRTVDGCICHAGNRPIASWLAQRRFAAPTNSLPGTRSIVENWLNARLGRLTFGRQSLLERGGIDRAAHGIAKRKFRHWPLLIFLSVVSIVPARAEPAPTAPSWGFSWFDPANSPFIPIPEVGTDPNSGTTVGFLPVFLSTDDENHIRQIVAPDIIKTQNFGYGVRGRLFSYPSEDTQWSLVAGVKQRVEREFDGVYSTGITRQDQWSIFARLVYDRSGTARFYGIGNESRRLDQTNYTNEQGYVETEFGFNLSRQWQIAYIARPHVVDVEPGTLPGLPSVERLFPDLKGLGNVHEFFNRFQLTYDTRDSTNVPRHGVDLVALFGFADRSLLSSVSYTVVSVDGRGYWPIDEATTLATRLAFRYMPTAGDAPFWALSSLGGDRAVVGDQQPLRGFGEDRFVDRHSVGGSVEVRRRVLDLHLFTTDLSLELAPFLDVGRVFSRLADNPLDRLHVAGGLGFRAVASPFLVGYVDIGYGSEGTAIFSGLNYPF